MNGHGAGWLLFASIVLIVSGIMRVFDSIWLFSNHTNVARQLPGALLGTSLTTYAWIYLLVGILLIVAGFGVMTGSQAARWIGIIAGAMTIVSAGVLMPYYPIWSLVYVVLGVLVVYGLAAYGGDEVTA